MDKLPKSKRKKVYLGLSGGVDSAVSALLLKNQGYDVTGVFMKNWSGDDFGIDNECPWEKDQKDAQAVCKFLNIPFQTFNFEEEYQKFVVNYFFEEYQAGRTPNPDIMCNQTIKFGSFLDKALECGADLIATGHYAGMTCNSDNSRDLTRAKDQNKDQTYFLYRLNQKQLQHSLFPLANLTKSEVRQIAEENNLPVAQKKDSQGICFIGKVDIQEFLQEKIKPQIGNIIDIDTNEIIGKHNGSWFYTLGQREGLKIGGAAKPYFVASKNTEENIIYVAQGKDNPKLYIQELTIDNISWINKAPQKQDLRAMVRYRQTPQSCTLKDNIVNFDNPQWLPSEGQSVVLIDNNKVLGGGIIKKFIIK